MKMRPLEKSRLKVGLALGVTVSPLAVPQVQAVEKVPVKSATRSVIEKIPAAREPLTFRDSGVYGGWTDYWLSDECPFNFFIVQAVIEENGNVTSHGQGKGNTWAKWLQRSRAKGKRIIADVMPNGWYQAKDPVAHFKKGLDAFMAVVDQNQLYAITLGEENIYWDGHEEMLKELYAYAKSKYNVPVYQSYSPYAHPPGFGWPHLPADGWMIDEYARGGASFEEFVRSYSIHQVPIVQIVWAAPLMRDFDWNKAGEPAFDWQIAVGRKYNIPTSYFAWEGRGNTWGWSPEALPLTKSVFERAKEWTRRAAVTDIKPYAGQWDEIASLQPQPFSYAADKTASFSEDFRTSGGLSSKGAVTQGFRDIRWAGGPLQLRPRNKGAASARLQYPLHSQFPLSDINVQVAGQGALTVSASPDGRYWTAPRNLPPSGELTLSLAHDPLFKNSTDVWVRAELKGTARAAGDVVASLHSIQVNGRFQDPQVKEIELPVAPGTPLQWKADMNGALLFTSEIENAAKLVSARGSLGIEGVAGNANMVTIRQKFVCPAELDLQKVISINSGDQPNYSATNKLGISLDGKTVLSEKTTSGVANNAELSLDLGSEPSLRKVKEFWVFLTMTNGSGVKTEISNRITGLRIEGMGVKAVIAAAG